MCEKTLPCSEAWVWAGWRLQGKWLFCGSEGLEQLKCPGFDAGRLGLRGEDSHSKEQVQEHPGGHSPGREEPGAWDCEGQWGLVASGTGRLSEARPAVRMGW